MSEESNRLIWIDCEMTGLDPKSDTIIEIASVVTDDLLQIIEKGPNVIIHQPQERLSRMDEWNTSHHSASGLYKACLESSVSTKQAEEMTLDFLKKHCKKGVSPLCGNSVHHDWLFMKASMPSLCSFFHYRHIDVSSIKELAKRWKPSAYQQIQKKGSHRALDDIIESIEELSYYRESFFHIID